MKHSLSKRFICLLCTLCLFFSIVPNASAAATKKNTGFTKGQVICTTSGVTGSGRTRYTYTKSKDVYISETKKVHQHQEDLTSWTRSDEISSLSCSWSDGLTYKGSVSKDLAKGFKLSAEISKSKQEVRSYNLKPVISRGEYCRMATYVDWFVVKYEHITYNAKGQKTGSSIMTKTIPVPDSIRIELRYTN